MYKYINVRYIHKHTSMTSSIFGFLSSKKTPVNNTVIPPVNVPVSTAAPEVQVPVVKDKLKRRTMDSKASIQSDKVYMYVNIDIFILT
jgi:hypothetical protein